MNAKEKARVVKKCKNDGINRVALGDALRRFADRRSIGRDKMAALVKDAPSQMSRLMTGHDDEFSADRLIKMMARLGFLVTVTIRDMERISQGGIVIQDYTKDPLGLRVRRVRGSR